MSVDDVVDILAVDLIGTILDDEQIVIATNQGTPLSGKNSPAEEEYRNICRRLLGEEIPFLSFQQKKGVFSDLKVCLKNREGGDYEIVPETQTEFRAICER